MATATAGWAGGVDDQMGQIAGAAEGAAEDLTAEDQTAADVPGAAEIDDDALRVEPEFEPGGVQAGEMTVVAEPDVGVADPEPGEDVVEQFGEGDVVPVQGVGRTDHRAVVGDVPRDPDLDGDQRTALGEPGDLSAQRVEDQGHPGLTGVVERSVHRVRGQLTPTDSGDTQAGCGRCRAGRRARTTVRRRSRWVWSVDRRPGGGGGGVVGSGPSSMTSRRDRSSPIRSVIVEMPESDPWAMSCRLLDPWSRTYRSIWVKFPDVGPLSLRFGALQEISWALSA